MISVLICRKEHDFLLIDSWVMSCRVLKRNVEEAVCNYLVNYAKEHCFSIIRGQFIPTERNGIVQDLYQNLGFKFVEKNNGIEFWDLNISEYTFFDPPIEIV